MEARLKRLTERYREDERAAASVVPPTPCVFDVDEWPSHAQVWLYKAGFSKPMIQKRGVYYHPPTDRVVLPLVEDGKLVYWQARGFSVDSAKYINPQVDRSKLVAKCGQGDLLVLTEDILSCWKVGEVTEAWSLMGVVLHPSALNRIVQDRRRVAVWLDPDKAGQEGMATIVRTLRLYSVDVTRIDSDKDPKLYTFKEIACHLNLPYCG
ncbi:DNA primase [Aquamicrobium phage P14]|uniref:Putative DNA primase n=1 Tax=Aquamicrobium phage P14 TaxID=1927013 RepID=A0A1L5C057_9CAUD|nr:DNA primase [Aquamicrobium phage P14]APL99478.1 putative DNA primase [Aquamicrobium phage P14]